MLFWLYCVSGTMCRFTKRGKVAVQMDDGSGTKVVSWSSVKPAALSLFSLDQMPMTDTLLETWATLLSLTTYSHSFKTVPGKFDLSNFCDAQYAKIFRK